MKLARVTNHTHWFGVALLFISSILLLMVTISAPVTHHLGLLSVQLGNTTTDQGHQSTIHFGTLGYCTSNTAQGGDVCTGRHIGYNPAHVMASIDNTQFGYLSAGTSDSLTRVMVLHPIACGVTFIAFLLSIGAGIVGSLASFFAALLAWALTFIVMATDFVLFGIVRRHVNDGQGSPAQAHFSKAIWMLVVAFLLELLGMVIVLFTCLSARRTKKKG
ncbi:related to palI [Lecanosticta acicola]|uniref:Related to palI n=1 Tax=Lecanosticta acicola TaxID=111012 RepID=A0AAI8YRA4_9PEZI|nr:related to palI [Lecanosticta acicola]